MANRKTQDDKNSFWTPSVFIIILLFVILTFGFIIYHDHRISEVKTNAFQEGKNEGIAMTQEKFTIILDRQKAEFERMQAEQQASRQKRQYILRFNEDCSQCKENEKLIHDMIKNGDF
ncbi:MAG: hypothetical protein ACOC56_04605 [Atribacterota bacterium]